MYGIQWMGRKVVGSVWRMVELDSFVALFLHLVWGNMGANESIRWKENEMSKHYAIKESIHIESGSSPVFSCWTQTITGEPIESNIYYVGDMYEVVSRCGDYEENETVFSEYFTSLASAIDYAETV
jgi:hypothetical protein